MSYGPVAVTGSHRHPLDPTEPVAPSPSGKERKSRTLLVVIFGVIGVLLIVLIVLLVSLLNRMGGSTPAEVTPSGTASTDPTSSGTTPEPTSLATTTTPSPVPEATHSPTMEPGEATPSATGPRFTTFDAPATEGGCSAGGPSFAPTPPLVKVAWTTAGAEQAWFVNGTSDAADSGFMQIPLAGSQSDFPYEQVFSCGSDGGTYTITLVGSDGTHVSKSWTVQNTGEIL